MGTCYTLADHKNRRLYDLDKAYHVHVAMCEEDSFRRASRDDFVARFPFDTASRHVTTLPEDRAYFDRVVGELYAFCAEADWDVNLLTDTGDDAWILQILLGYVYTGSRMGCDMPPEDRICPRCGDRGCERAYPNEHDGDEERDAEYRARHSVVEGERYVEELRRRRSMEGGRVG